VAAAVGGAFQLPLLYIFFLILIYKERESNKRENWEAGREGGWFTQPAEMDNLSEK